MNSIDAEAYLRALVVQTIRTLTGKPNYVKEIQGMDVIVSTKNSPEGKPVPIEWVQTAIDRLLRDGEIEINVETVGHRSAFVGAVLATLPGAVSHVNPRRILLDKSKGETP